MSRIAVADRAEVAPEDRWHAESLFPTPAAWEEALAGLKEDLGRAERFQGRLAQGPEVLREWLSYADDIGFRFGHLNVYALMDYSTDTTDQAAGERFTRVRSLAGALQEAFAFSGPELMEIGIETLRRWVESEPALKPYDHFVTRLEHQAPHLRSTEVEELLGSVSSPFAMAASAHGVLANTDLTFEDAFDEQGGAREISQGNIRDLLGSADRTLRQSAYEHYADAHLQFKNTMAVLLATGIKQNNAVAKARRYGSTLAMALEQQKLPMSVFTSLLDTFKAHLPVWHRYWRVKRQMLGLKTFEPFDIHAPLTRNGPVISFEQSVTWLAEALAPLGENYVATMRRGALEERWVDKYSNKGKRMGAFSAGVQGAPPFILMSYSDDVFGMSTLAHELGHSMHSYMSGRHQPYVYSRYSLFEAEVASNFNQAMLRHYLFQALQDRDAQIAIIDEAMANFYRYFFLMPTLARFEQEIHERDARGEALSAATLNGVMSELLAEGYGGEVSFDAERVGITWAQFHTHLYRRFYVYQYTTGIAGAHGLAKGILDGKPGAVENYLGFLKSGGSRFPLDSLRSAGVDLASPKPIEETFAVLEALVDRLESLAA